MAQFNEKGFFINENGENSKNFYKPKLTDDIVQPKRPSSAYIFFNVEHAKKLRAADPSLGTAEITKKCGEDWNSLGESEKKRYHNLADQDKVRYQEQMD